MSNEVINQSPSIERAKELEHQAKEGLSQMKQGQDIAIIACHKMRDTKAYKTLGFDSYYDWGETTLHLKKSRLNELALAGEVQQELLTAVESNVEQLDNKIIEAGSNITETIVPSTDNVTSEEENVEENKRGDTIVLAATHAKPIATVSDLSEITTPQLVALAKAPKGERIAVLDKVVEETKAEDIQITTSIIKEAVKASAEPVKYTEPSEKEKAIVIKKQHKSAMGKVSKLTDVLNELDTAKVDIDEVENWKAYLDEVKLSITTLEKQLGYELY
jgi:hypothetical protein